MLFIIPAAALVGLGASLSALISRKLLTYKPPKVWKHEQQGGTWGHLNKPTAGPQSEKDLPRGEHPLQLHSLGTPNGVKVTVLLEELNLLYGVEYDAYLVNIGSGDQFTSGFVGVNPNSKIPALLDYSKGDTTEPTRVFESAAILLHLCEQFDTKNSFMPPVGHPMRAECLSWLMWTQGSAPFLGGGFGHFFNYAPVKIKYAIDRYSMETKRQMDVLERHLGGVSEGGGAGGPFLCGDQYTIADMACWPWYGALVLGRLYTGSDEFLELEKYTNVIEWAKRIDAREGVRRGRIVNKTWGAPEEQMKERHSSNDFVSTEEKKD